MGTPVSDERRMSATSTTARGRDFGSSKIRPALLSGSLGSAASVRSAASDR